MILITGGLGFIGAHTTRALLDTGEKCVVTSHSSRNVPSFLQAELDQSLFVEPADVTKLDDLVALGKKHEITGIVHLAAPRIGAHAIVDELRLTLEGLFNILEVATIWKVRRTVITSSIGVYGAAAIPLREDAPLSMLSPNPIAASKKSFEILGDVVAARSDLDIVFVRPSAIWGPLGRTKSIFFSLPQLLHAAAGSEASKSQELGTIYAEDGIDMLYVKDCGRALALLATADELSERTYNVGSGMAATNAEVVAAIGETLPEAKLELQTGKTPGAGENFYLDLERLRRDTGFEPAYSLTKGIADYLDWIKAEQA